MGYYHENPLDNVDVFFLCDADAADLRADDSEPRGSGYYWGFGAVGCLYDTGPEGPYDSEADAIAAACHALGLADADARAWGQHGA
jgi:hypothetical protein